MIEFDSYRRQKAGGLSFVILLLAGLLLFPAEPCMAQQKSLGQSAAAPRCTSADQCLSLGMFYYNNDDISERAPNQFRLVMKNFRGSAQQVESAQYYLASFYQRKYYIEKWKQQSKDDQVALRTAAKEYRKYTDQYYKSGAHTWLAEAFFNLALVDLQLHDPVNAFNELSKMRDASRVDGSAYVYQVVWSADPNDVVDAYLPTRSLAEYALSILYPGNTVQQGQSTAQSGYGDPFASTVVLLRKWCQSLKSKQPKKGR